MIRITELWSDPAPPHQFVSDSVQSGSHLYKDFTKVLASPFFTGESITIVKNTRISAGLGAVGNAPVNSIVINGPEELT